MTAAAPLDGLARALAAAGDLVAAVRDDQWSDPTPCREWNVRQLVNHLVFGNRMFAGILRGEPRPSPESMARLRGVDQLGDDPTGAYRQSADAVQAAFGRPDVLGQVFQAPVGPVPGAVMLHLRITEALVHGWDLAQATGQPARLPEDLAQAELAFARSPFAPDVPRTGHPFGPAQPVTGEVAPAIDRLAAYLGRPVPPGPTTADPA